MLIAVVFLAMLAVYHTIKRFLKVETWQGLLVTKTLFFKAANLSKNKQKQTSVRSRFINKAEMLRCKLPFFLCSSWIDNS